MTIFIVIHLPADGHSTLDQVLAQTLHLETSFACDREPISPGRVYLAPLDRHLSIRGDSIRLSRAPRENRARPAIDVLFRSAALGRRERVLGVVLSGVLDDGAAGLLSVKRCGGLAFVQEPKDAVETEMPCTAAEALGDRLDGALPAAALGVRMAEYLGSASPPGQAPHDVLLEMHMLLGEEISIETLERDGLRYS